MDTDEIFKRLRIGLALLAGYALGKWLGRLLGHHESEFFILGFALGVALTHGSFWLIRRWHGRRRSA